ncbi:MAG: ScpA family protein [Micavibrio sp.]|nr:ScpA family protein [Micavibrio sp.]
MTEAQTPKFEEDLLKERSESEQLLLYLGSFDGPIDMLLSLARDQKVDLTKISILALAHQYLDFVEKARALRLELAADYLVMAAWLAYLKSRMLIPQEERKQAEPTAQELADALQFQLRRLEAMRKTADDLFRLPRLGFNVFSRGEPEGLQVSYVAKYDMTYYDLLKAYGDVKLRQQNSVYKLNPVRLFTLEEAMSRMESMLGKIPQEWVSLFMFLPGGLTERIRKRSAVASTFGGALEMVKRGLLELQQEKNYAPIYIRRPQEKKAANGNVAAETQEVSEQSVPPAIEDTVPEHLPEEDSIRDELTQDMFDPAAEVTEEETIAEELLVEERAAEETPAEEAIEQIVAEEVAVEETETAEVAEAVHTEAETAFVEEAVAEDVTAETTVDAPAAEVATEATPGMPQKPFEEMTEDEQIMWLYAEDERLAAEAAKKTEGN